MLLNVSGWTVESGQALEHQSQPGRGPSCSCPLSFTATMGLCREKESVTQEVKGDGQGHGAGTQHGLGGEPGSSPMLPLHPGVLSFPVPERQVWVDVGEHMHGGGGAGRDGAELQNGLICFKNVGSADFGS